MSSTRASVRAPTSMTVPCAILFMACPAFAATPEDCFKKTGDAAIVGCTLKIEADPTSGAAYNNRAIEYRRQGHLEQAIADFGKAIEIDPKNARSYYNRGTVYLALGQTSKKKEFFERAIADFSAAIAVNPKYAKAFGNRGLSYAMLGQHEQAISDYDKNVEIAPDDLNAHTNRAYSCLMAKRYDCARADTNKAIELDSKHYKAYRTRAQLNEAEGKKDAAILDYQAALKFAPDKKTANVMRADLLRLGVNLPEPAVDAGSKECAERLASAEKCHKDYLTQTNDTMKGISRACLAANCGSAMVMKCPLPPFCTQ